MEPEKQRRGRPRKSSANAKSISVLLRMEPGEKAAFGDAAAIAGIPLSVWIRERLRLAAARELEGMDRPVAFLESLALRRINRNEHNDNE